MAFKKRVSTVLSNAEDRARRLSTIEPDMELAGLRLADYQAQIASGRQLLDKYNSLLTEADMMADQFDNQETVLRDLSERMLMGIATRYGKNSPQYEAAGGVRKSERRKPAPKAKAEG